MFKRDIEDVVCVLEESKGLASCRRRFIYHCVRQLSPPDIYFS